LVNRPQSSAFAAIIQRDSPAATGDKIGLSHAAAGDIEFRNSSKSSASSDRYGRSWQAR